MIDRIPEDYDYVPLVGREPVDGEAAQEDVPYAYVGCGHCGGLSSDFWPDYWRRGELDPGDKGYFPTLCHCDSCGNYSLVIRRVTVADDGRAQMGEGYWQYPPVRPSRIEAQPYRDTLIEDCRFETWACYYARRYRAALVMARTTLQTMGRRYLQRVEWGAYGNEMAKLGEIAGPGWEAIAVGIKTLGNEAAHPDPWTDSAPTRESALAALNRMDKVLAFTAEMEDVGHLVPSQDASTAPEDTPEVGD